MYIYIKVIIAIITLYILYVKKCNNEVLSKKS